MLSRRDPRYQMASGCYKASPPFLFPSTQQHVLLILLLCLAFMMMPFVMTSTSTTTSTSNTTFTKGCNKEERDALLAFKAQIIYPKAHPISSWGHHTDDCCQWAGVRCDNISGHVFRLDLQTSLPPSDYDDDDYFDYSCDFRCGKWGLSGKINQSLIGLRHLTYLDLSGNCFLNISIPKWLGSLDNLVHLDLSYSCFTGVIPHELGNLTRLRYLNLETYDNYEVDNAEWLSSLSSLRYLLMDGVNFSGVNFSGVNNVMQSLNKLRHLKNVSLSDCQMNSIPESLPHLNFTSLTFMDIGWNMFDDMTSIPEWLFRIPNLRELSMAYCGLTGTVLSSIGNATSLQFLDLSANDGVSGDMPRGFGDLCNLLSLHLDGTFVGKSLGDFKDAFSGCIRRNLNALSFGYSSLQGPLPDWLGEFRNLTGLFLSDNSFSGSLPESLGRLSRLQDLDLAYNAFSGSLPESLGRLSRLQDLDLAYNAFNGSIPSSIGDLCNLQSLNLGGTFFGKSLEEDFRDAFSGCIRRNLNLLSFRESLLQGPLPNWLGEFRNLTSLFLFNNSFHGSIPESLGRLSRLKYLSLSENALNGSIPESLGRLSSLQYLDLRYNMLNGPIPESLGQLSNLSCLGLSDNNFNYSSVITEAHLANLTSLTLLWLDHVVLNISTDWSPGFQADEISLSYCRVGPKFPVWLANQVNLQGLYMSNTGIKDSMPDWFWDITNSMTSLDLSNNEINGRLPQHLKFQGKGYSVTMFLGSNRFEGFIPYFPPNIYALDLSNNSLSGNIPSDLGNFGGIRPELTSLILSANNLTGSIPNSLCNLVDLVLLELSNNHLEGAIPNCWNNSRRLRYLILANNSLVGEVPNSLKSSSQFLQVLHLSNNQLHGEFPLFLKKCTSVTTLALDHNNLSGNIPSWVGESLTSLMILTLKKNNFSGNLPLLSNLISLHFLDLSHNSFVGSIPQSYGNLRGMINGSMNGGARFPSAGEAHVIKIIIFIKGLEIQFGVTLSSLKFIDLSTNNLSGQIPKEIVNLAGLQNLDLSHNTLSGEIPSDIGRMQSLESLDLSRNELFGSIPPGLSTLHFLESLNLSYNNLSGKIPYASQLTTFNDPSSYAGNLYLCGAPLSKNCTRDESTSTSQVDDQEDDDDNWFCIGLMSGFVVGFWIVWITLLIKKEWRYAYFRFMDHMYDMVYVKIVVTIAKIKRA